MCPVPYFTEDFTMSFTMLMKKPSILIVDDDRITRDSLAGYLDDEYTTFKASDGMEALKLLRENTEITVVLSDVDMPSMDGFELLHSIRNEIRDVKLIFVSSNSAVDIKTIGAYDYLPKPIDLNRLSMTLKNALKSE
jgi:DNA-binding NtrC family response regulator